MADDNIQHGIDDNPSNDAEKGAALGGLGGAAVGAIAGAAAGPVGAVVGAVAGGLAGAGASGAAVGAIDQVDNDNTITGLGDDSQATYKNDDDLDAYNSSNLGTTAGGTDYRTADLGTSPSDFGTSTNDFRTTDSDAGALTDYRNAETGVTSIGATDMNADAAGDTIGNGIPGVQTGGTTLDGTPDTRGLTEKAADALTGDKYDDNTGKRVDY
jgi:hypothetical protein